MPEPLPMIISVDDHVVEPPNVWQDRLPSKYADVGPRIVRAPMPEVKFRGGSLKVKPGSKGVPVDWWYYEDLKRPLLRVDSAVGVPRDEVTMKGVTYEDMRPGSYEVKPRLEDMDVNHIEAALCFPTFPRFCGQTFTEAKDHDLGLLCVKAYNDWMVEEWCGESGGRLIPLCLIPLWDAELAAAEVLRNAERGVRAVCFSEIPPYLGLPSVHDPEHYWDPFFRACARRPVRPGPPQRPLLGGRLPLQRRVRAHPRTQGGLLGGPDRLDPLHLGAGRPGVGGQPRLGRRRRHRAGEALELLQGPRVGLLLRRRPRAQVGRRDRRGQ